LAVRRRIDTEIGGVFAVELRAGAGCARAQLNGRHVRQAHQLAAFAAANHNLPEAGGVAESPDTVDGQRLLLAVKYRRRPHLPRRALHVLLAQRRAISSVVIFSAFMRSGRSQMRML
jgi:hypothetical protein